MLISNAHAYTFMGQHCPFRLWRVTCSGTWASCLDDEGEKL